MSILVSCVQGMFRRILAKSSRLINGPGTMHQQTLHDAIKTAWMIFFLLVRAIIADACG